MPVAADAPPGLDALAQYGAIGILCAALAWFAYKAYQREAQRADRLDAEVNRLNGIIQDKAIPALLSATSAMTEVIELLRDMQRDQRQRYRDGDRG